MQKWMGKLTKSVLATCSLAFPCLLMAQSIDENLLKAAYTFKFILYIKWDDHPLINKDEITLCVNENSKMSKVLRALDGKTFHTSRLRVKSLKSVSAEVQQCQVLYVDQSDNGNWLEIQKKIAHAKILTIFNSVPDREKSAMIFMWVQDKKITFDIDRGVVQKSGLRLSSKLYRTARKVY